MMYLPTYLTPLPLLLLIFEGLGSSLLSQETAQSPPNLGNLVRRPPAMAAWSITYRNLGPEPSQRDLQKAEKASGVAIDRAAVDRTIQSTNYKKTGAVGVAELRYSDGTKEEHYIAKDIALQDDPEGKTAKASVVDTYAGEALRFVQSYPGVAWVKPEHFLKRVVDHGEPCLQFHQAAGDGSANSGEAKDSLAYDPNRAVEERDAWFSEATGLPVAFRIGNMLARYSHHSPPSEVIALPVRFQKALLSYLGFSTGETISVTPQGKFVFGR
jgi:hypothetical protein